jgi:hypothetical protein
MQYSRIAWIALILTSAGANVSAAVPVEISATTPDMTGSRFVFALKERIRSSKSLELTFDQGKPRFQVQIVTLNPNGGSDSHSTVYSVVITWKSPDAPFPLYITSYVGVVGGANVKDGADGVAAAISEQADSIERATHNGAQRQP